MAPATNAKTIIRINLAALLRGWIRKIKNSAKFCGLVTWHQPRQVVGRPNA